jgi:type IX secretion system PorP/SprF family membrane protein
MIFLRNFVISVLYLSSFFFGFGQDIHWSQFNDNQLFQNPGNAGHFDGDYRFVGNFRDQWRSVTIPYNTFSMSADAKLKHWGIGLLMFHDQAGDGTFRTIEMQGNISRSFKLSKDSTHVFRPGINFGMNHRQLNWDKLYFDSQYNGYILDQSLPSNENYQSDRKTNLSMGAGLIYEWQKSNRLKISTGFGAYNLNQPNQGFYNTQIKRDVRYNSFLKGTFLLNENWDVVPSIQYSQQGVYREFILGTSGKYYLKSSKGVYRAIYGGLWYRTKDAGYLSLGYDFKDLFVGVSYDVNFSKLVPASNNRGGFEIAVRYIIRKFKPKNIIHRVCPDFI